MFHAVDFKYRQYFQKLKKTKTATFFVLSLERLSLSLWRIISWTLLFFGLWLFEIHQFLGLEFGAALSVLYFAGLFYFCYKDFQAFQWPRHNEILKRIEQSSALKNRPLSSLEDRLVNAGKTDSRALWKSHQEKLLSDLQRLKSPAPRPLLAMRDPYALRLLALFLFFCGILIANHSWQDRIFSGLVPFSPSFTKAEAEARIHVWITPPDYTNLERFVLTENLEDDMADKTLQIPEGSVLKASVKSSFFAPRLLLGDEGYDFNKADDKTYVIERVMPDVQSFQISEFFIPQISWDYELIADQPPTLSLKSPDEMEKAQPKVLQDKSIEFPLSAYDDYGVQSLYMSMNLDPVVEQAPLGEPVSEVRSIISPADTQFDFQPVYDLTAHPWAGLPVVFTFEAEDHLGQRGTLEPISIILPERDFQHPVAKTLIALRKKLGWAPLDDYTEIARTIEAILKAPGSFQDDQNVYLAMRSAASRLIWSRPSIETAQSVMALLWDTALQIEDGDLALAARNLRDAQNALENALRNPNISDEQLAELMNELRQAMADYFTELGRELQKRRAEGTPIPLIPPELLKQLMNPETLGNFLDQLEQDLRSGDKGSAQEMLSELQRMLDQMNPSRLGEMPPDMQMMSEGINELQQLIERQEQLLEQTELQKDKMNRPPLEIERGFGETLPEQDLMQLEEWGIDDLPPPPSTENKPPEREVFEANVDTSQNKTEQEALRFILGQLMLDAADALDTIPEGLGLAEQEMRGSSSALGENRPDISIPHQEKALEYLKQAQNELTQQLQKRFQQMMGIAMSQGGSGKLDPLGRPYGGENNEGNVPGSKVEIPDEAEQKRAQEILRLLRKRSGELERPDLELDYYRRLLKQF